MHFKGLRKDLSKPNKLLGVDIHQFSSRSLNGSGVKSEDGVVLNNFLFLNKLFHLIFTSINNVTQLFFVKSRPCPLLLKHLNIYIME